MTNEWEPFSYRPGDPYLLVAANVAPEDPQTAVDAEAEITGLVWPALLIGMGVLFTALILAAARGDLWLDEIWSCFNAWNAGSFGGVFSTHHDNNHVLNSLYVLCIGEARPLYLYRGLAILSGVGSLGLLGIIAWRQWGRRESIMAVLLGGCSYPILPQTPLRLEQKPVC